MIHVALFEPEIPPNTGNIARLCAAAEVPLHIVGEPAFRLDERTVRRAGLDYWPHVNLTQHPTLDHLKTHLQTDSPANAPPPHTQPSPAAKAAPPHAQPSAPDSTAPPHTQPAAPPHTQPDPPANAAPAHLQSTPGAPRIICLTTKATRSYTDWQYRPGDCLLFGPETRGLPHEILTAPGHTCLTIPMKSPHIRSLNLANAVSIVLYEALRQLR